MLAEGGKRRLPLPMQVALALLTTAITAAVLAIGIGVVIDKQYGAMERVALTSGSSIVVVRRRATRRCSAAENIARPPEERDWVPAQAFVNTRFRPIRTSRRCWSSTMKA